MPDHFGGAIHFLNSECRNLTFFFTTKYVDKKGKYHGFQFSLSISNIIQLTMNNYFYSFDFFQMLKLSNHFSGLIVALS